MCGIAAFVANGNISSLHREALVKSLQLLAHRGEFSFQQEMYSAANVIGGVNRLSFTSATERQPVASPSGRLVVFLNGELYDFHPRGHDKRSDTSELAHFLEREGLDRFRDMDGIYAVIVIDIQQQDVWLLRDKFGVKPLFYAVTEHGIIMASEVKALAAHDFVHEIKEVPPGTFITISLNTLHIEELEVSHRGISVQEDTCENLNLFAERISELFRQAVIEQTRDGQKYAVYLSGGLDSSSIYALCKNEGIDVTPLVLGNASSPDISYAKRLCAAFGDEPYVVACPPEEELFRILQTVIYHCESFEPNVVRASALSWILAQGALAHGFRVALCGEGADELFGGYPEFFCGTLGFETARHQFVQDLHRTQLQRVDRINMAATIEARVPFLSRRLASFVLSHGSPDLYIRKSSHGIETKVALRLAMHDLLPSEIVHRPKVVMNEGAGYGSNDPEAGMFSGLINKMMSDDEFQEISAQFAVWSISTKEEAAYFRIFRRAVMTSCYLPKKGFLQIGSPHSLQ